jgi:hypothetical protein
MLTPVDSSKFRKDVKKMQKRGKGMKKLRRLLTLLIEEQDVPDSYQAIHSRVTGCLFGMPTSNRIDFSFTLSRRGNFSWQEPALMLTFLKCNRLCTCDDYVSSQTA